MHKIKISVYVARETDACPKCGMTDERETEIFQNPETQPQLKQLAQKCGDVWHKSEDFVEFELPAKWEICSRCNGDGKHSNPSIDGNGITEEDWRDWDDEDRERYFSGGYDVPCEASCNNGKQLVPDESRCNREQKAILERYREHEADRAREAAEDRRTLYYESGGTMGSLY